MKRITYLGMLRNILRIRYECVKCAGMVDIKLGMPPLKSCPYCGEVVPAKAYADFQALVDTLEVCRQSRNMRIGFEFSNIQTESEPFCI